MSNVEDFIRKCIETDMGAYNVLQGLIGNCIGRGMSRWVFDNPNDDGDTVLKICVKNNISQNINESVVWDYVAHTDHAKFFAPVKWVSGCGRVLCMKKAQPFHSKDISKVPAKIPSVFTDFKRENYGWIGNNFVCLDYGLLINHGLYNALGRQVKNKTL